MSGLPDLVSVASGAVFLSFLVGIPVYGFFKGVKVYETFVDGAREGFDVAVRIIPYLVAILVAIGMFRASGAMDLITSAMPTAVRDLGISPLVLSLILMRPLSGSASLGILAEIISSSGADSYEARLAAVILGSTETTLYVIAVYFGAISVNRVRYAVHAGLIADAAGVCAAVILCWVFFG
ncbi:MAG TPA: nucleoside recognition domain-containing protein [Desulfomonilaceae bacterium]|nr:nucleoside recognition domain-containing protein [Desulfomonilaceae bacterium]